ncbi:ATP-dependent DNA helicase RecG [candidate division WWE3 bacterium]|uniref:Probable DNA 3'-5' helicase RecG n=1 Tax=candidate division WWE3 bacterium TaxID=2053526 RepID=A0A7X9E7C2_UNCKA|nr:ATP-dependent DNA helicase RecG [candidate division WWE3 bacterium]
MINVESPISAVPKIGPKYKKLLENLDIYTIEDLLYHLPFRYNDYSKFKNIKDLKEGDIISVKAILGSIENIYTRGRKRITKAIILDYTGELNLIWFNQHYIKDTLNVGKNYLISGKVTIFDKKLCFISPEIEAVYDEEKQRIENINTGRLVPIYPETSGVSSKWLRTKIKFLFNSETNIEEFLPKELLKEKNFKEVKEALERVHFPDSEEQAKENYKRFEFEELFIELLNVEKRKSEWLEKSKGHKLKGYYEELNKLINSLPFKLTKSQSEALEEILDDIQKPMPMNRLLEGDVGTGKTILAILASYVCYLNGLKTLYMAPTEILANQHFDTFNKILKGTNVKVEIETGSKKGKGGEWDVLVGTHALLFPKDAYNDIGLIIIDEQHRFGVEQRGKITELVNGSIRPHLLTMTATPIPRTLALTLYGDLAISVLKDFPFEQRKINTKVIPEKMREQAYRWIKDRGEQTFIVCPLIEESESSSLANVKAAQAEYEFLRNNIFKGVSVGLLHGKMKSKEKEKAINDFKNSKIKVLISTPVIEVGVDVPNATVIVIESADRYGLASLHQLRGRVGRSDKEGFCFAFMSNNSRNSYKRLKYLEELNNGIELAEIDLKMRGQGDIFGASQHGFKKLRIANLNDLNMLQEAKTEAQKYYQKLKKYPKLENKLTQRKGKYITSN